MRSFKHLSLRYMLDRLSLMRYEKLNPEHPWLTSTMINILNTWLHSSDVGLEYGSGRSTLWLAKHVRHITSVEHNRDWYAKVKNQINSVQCSVNLQLHEDGIAESEESAYVEVARSMPSSSLDFVLVDGVSRDYCALESLDKLKPCGLLIIDNVNLYFPREPKTYSPNSRSIKDGYASETWEIVGERIKNWRCIWTSNGIWDTACWIKT